MPPHSSQDTPVMRQYLEVKQRYPDCILFFRLGDFYEMFFEDAVLAARLLDLTLTSRDKHKEDKVPMCGVPYHAAKNYIGRLIEHGHKVAICDQVEDARLAKKIVRRAVTQVVTPGVVLDEEQLAAKAGRYLASIAPGSGPLREHAGLAYVDASTGEFAATQLPLAEVVEELCRIGPSEILIVGGRERAPSDLMERIRRRLPVPAGESAPADEREDRALLVRMLGEGFPEESGPAGTGAGLALAISAAASCARYLSATQPAGSLPLFRLRTYQRGDEMIIDEASCANLELFRTVIERRQKGALFSVLDRTATAMGGRLLRRWLRAPLLDLGAIRRRHDAVGWLLERHSLRDALHEALTSVHDIERLTGRMTLMVATPRDLSCLMRSLRQLAVIRDLFAGSEDALGRAEEGMGAGLPPGIDLGSDLGADVADAIAAALVDEPPAQVREGGIIRKGYNAELDELSELARGGKDSILRIEERERERTGISSLKVRYNKVFGYYLEITRTHLGKVPPDYIRKQTMANAERYVTPELMEHETRVLSAEERSVQLEQELFEALRVRLLPEASRLLNIAARVAQLDALCSLAEVAHAAGYVRPEMDDSLCIDIEDGRHPVVEQLAEKGRFVPNDVSLSPDEAQLVIITGPNMAGKSTFLRQVALMSILAQMGSFVPARRARLGIVDRVFTRVGAGDNLAGGESTFMVEMRETAHILAHASRRSLVVLDEIGRGTSTYDGVSIAWAVAEHLHDRIGCKTLFATHYHELCALAASRERVRNLSVAVREQDGEIVFLHRLVEGGASRSYGIEVARLAGLPASVVDRSKEILRALEAGESCGVSLPLHGMPPVEGPQLSLFGAAAPSPLVRKNGAPEKDGARAPGEAAVLSRLRDLDPDSLTPRQALSLLSDLVEHLTLPSR